MRIQIKATNLDLTPSIREYVEEKIGSLDKFLERFEKEGEIEVFIEVARTTKHHRSGKVFYAEVTFSLGKKVFRAEDLNEDIRLAIDEVRDKLQQEIKKYKEMKIDRHV
ncbi:MAG: ribosome-associated translation inhibitor RaiA [Spirochaetota bacterium]